MKNHMRYVFILILSVCALFAQAQQVNPVPDYTFANRMSAGRNTVTDTAAYFSIGPRYGAIRGMMPPMVVDTASVSGNKRNGLLIFSIQKNKFLYWDSVRVQWSDMAGGSGSYILAGDTSAMLAPYLRKADTTAMLLPYFRKADTATLSNRINLKLNISDTSSMLGNYIRHAGYGLTKSGQSFLVDTVNISTRAWGQKGLDSLAALRVSGTGTSNFVAKFTGTSTIGNSQIRDNGASVGLGITPSGWVSWRALQNGTFSMANISNVGFLTANAFWDGAYKYVNTGTSQVLEINNGNEFRFLTAASGTSGTAITFTQAMTLNNAAELYINTTTDNGDFKLQVNGNALISGNIRTAAPAGGTANDWRLGTVATVSPTSPNRTIEVSIGGTIYYIHAKTTND